MRQEVEGERWGARASQHLRRSSATVKRVGMLYNLGIVKVPMMRSRIRRLAAMALCLHQRRILREGGAMREKRGRWLCGLVAAVAMLATAGTASATPVGFGVWYSFGWLGDVATDGDLPTFGGPNIGSLTAPGASPWEFVAPSDGAILRVTDLQADIDSFEVFDFGFLVGSTPLTNSVTTACGVDPDACIADGYSNGSFFFAAGAHEITFFDVDPNGVTGYGAFRVDPVPEPATMALLGMGLAGLGLTRKKRSA